MKSPVLLSILLAFALTSIASPEQRGFPSPPNPMNTDNTTTTEPPVTISRHVDLAAMQKEADVLAQTAQTIPGDMASVRKGMLPKDFVQKLKQIEKLSKHLRSQVSE